MEDSTHLTENLDQVLHEAEDKSIQLMEEVNRSTHANRDTQSIVQSFQQNLLTILYLPTFQEKFPFPHSRKYQHAMKYLHAGNLKTSPWRNGDAYAWSVILGWSFTYQLGKIISDDGYEEISRSWMDEWMLNKIIVSALNDLGLDERSNWRAVTLIKLLTSHHPWWRVIGSTPVKGEKSIAYHILTSILSDSDALGYLGVNRYQDVFGLIRKRLKTCFGGYLSQRLWKFQANTIKLKRPMVTVNPSSVVTMKYPTCCPVPRHQVISWRSYWI